MHDYEEKQSPTIYWVLICSLSFAIFIILLLAILSFRPRFQALNQQIEVQQAQIAVLEDKIKHLPKNTVIVIQDGQVTDQYDVDSDEAKPEDDDTEQPCDQPKVNY